MCQITALELGLATIGHRACLTIHEPFVNWNTAVPIYSISMSVFTAQ